MALNRLGMGITISARDLATKTLQRVGRTFGKVSAHMQSTARKQEVAMRSMAMGASLALAGGGMLRGLQTATDYAGKFEQGMAGVGAITRATAQELGQLRDTAIEAGITTQFSPKAAQEGLLNLASAGQTATEATETLIPVLDLAAGSLGQLGVGEAATAVVGTLKSYGMAAGDAGVVTDKLLRITQLTNFQARDFEAGLAKAAGAAGVFGQSIEDTLAVVGQMRNANIDASSSSTAFREAVRRLGSDQGAQLAVERKGIEVYDKKTGKMNSIVDILLQMDEKTKKLSERERNRVVVQALGARGMLAFNAVQKATFTEMEDGVKVTYRGREAMERLRKELRSSTGTAKEFKDALLDTYEGQKTLLKGTLETWQVVIGEPLAQLSKPIVKGIVDVLNSLLRGFNNLSPEVKQVITGVASLGATLITLIGGAMVLKGVMSLLGMSFSGVLISLAQLVVLAPVLILLFGGLGAAAYAAYKAFSKNAGGIATSWQDAARQIKLGWQGVVAIVRGEPLSDVLLKDLDRAENQGVARFLRRFEVFFERMKSFWDGLKRGFEAGVAALADSPAMKRLTAAFSDVFSMFTGTEAQNSQDMLDQFGTSGERTGKRIAQLGEIALNAVLYLVDLGKRVVGFVSTLTAGDLSAGINGIVEDFRMLWGTLKDVAEVAGWIANGIRVVVNLLQTAAAFLAESFAGFFDFIGTSYSASKKMLSGEFGAAADEFKKFSATEQYTETRRQAGDVVRVFDKDSRLGIEGEPLPGHLAKIKERETAKRLEAVRERGRSVLAKGLWELDMKRSRGEDTTQVEALLRELNATMKGLRDKKVEPPKVTVNVARDDDGGLEPLFLPGGG